MLFNTLIISSLTFFLVEWFLSDKIDDQLAKRISRIFFLITSAITAIIFAFNLDSRDWSKYQEKFDRVTMRIEPGFGFLVNVVKKLGGDFTQILWLTGFLFLITMVLLVRSKHNNLVILLYAIYPLVWDLNQIRNLFMFLFILYAFYFMAYGKAIVSYLLILIATSFHYSALFYVPLYPLLKLPRKSFYRWMMVLLAIFSMGAVIVKIALNPMLDWLDSPQLNYYAHYIGDFSLFYFGIQVIHQCLDLLTVWWIDRQTTGKLDPETKSQQEVFLRAIFFTTLYLPAVAFFDEIHRLRRNAQLVKYMFSANAFRYLNNQQRIIVLVLLLMNLALTLYMMYVAKDFELFDFVNANQLVEWIQR